MNNMLYDIFPAQITPHPEGVPDARLRVVGFDKGIVVLWDGGGTDGPSRVDIMSTDYEVTRKAGCPTCGARRLRGVKVTGLIEPVEEPEPEPVKRTRTRRKQTVAE